MACFGTRKSTIYKTWQNRFLNLTTSASPRASPDAGDLRDIKGSFFLQIVDRPQDDVRKRPYLRPPPLGESVNWSFPLHDFRDAVFDAETSNGTLSDLRDGTTHPGTWSRSAAHLKSHGFTAIKHKTMLMESPFSREFLDSAALDNDDIREHVYYEEVKDIIKSLTGAKAVFVTNSYIRSSPRSEEDDEQRKRQSKDAEAFINAKVNDLTEVRKKSSGSMHGPTSAKIPPARHPHLDYTPRGARSTIRAWKQEIFEEATRCGVIEAEDDICARHSVKATETASDPVLHTEYNANGKLGPRYAAFSVWRPLEKVTRDPLAMAPYKTFEGCDELVLWSYNIRVPGAPELGGDFTRQLIQLKIDREKSQERGMEASSPSTQPRWYYLSEQMPDEVLILKFFDSAALGDDAEEAPGVPHGAPDIGEAAYGGPRESMEVRVIAFW